LTTRLAGHRRPVLLGDGHSKHHNQESVDFKASTDEVGTDVELVAFINADHKESYVTAPDFHTDELVRSSVKIFELISPLRCKFALLA